MCTRLRNGGKGEAFAEPFPAFRAEYTYLPIVYASTVHMYCIYPAISKPHMEFTDPVYTALGH
jgi:hypothetical protein